MKVIACYSSKGGVGKTSTTVNLAYAAAKAGHRTLLIDLDAQAASSFYFRIRSPRKHRAAAVGARRREALEAIRETDFKGLDLLPAHRSYRNLDTLLDGMKRSKTQLATFVEKVGRDYERVLLDCPPSLSLVAENVFRASDCILVPVIPTTLSERTYEQLKDFFDSRRYRKRKLHPFLSMAEPRKRLHADITEKLRKQEKRLLKAVIPYSSEVEAMGEYREPLLHHAPRKRSARAFLKLYKEMEEVLKS